MRLSRVSGILETKCFIFILVLGQGSFSTPHNAELKADSKITVSSERRPQPAVRFSQTEYLAEKFNTANDQPEKRLESRGLFDGIFGGGASQQPGNELGEDETLENYEVEDPADGGDPADADTRDELEDDKGPSPGGWFSGWNPAPKETTAKKETAAPTPLLGAQKLTPKATPGDGWLRGLWGSPSFPDTAPEAAAATGGLSSWFAGAPAAPSSDKKPKQHGLLRQFVKSVEHTFVPKAIRHSFKSIPGVRGTRQAMKSTLEAVDAVGDTEYVRNIKNAAKNSGKRVGQKAVGLADSVLDLSTGTTEATLNMVDTLQKESGRTLDGVSVAIPPARSTVDYVKGRMGDGVGYLQSKNADVRQRGKKMLSSLSSMTEVDATAGNSSGGGSWFNW